MVSVSWVMVDHGMCRNEVAVLTHSGIALDLDQSNSTAAWKQMWIMMALELDMSLTAPGCSCFTADSPTCMHDMLAGLLVTMFAQPP